MEPVKLWDEGQLSYMTSHELYTKYTHVLGLLTQYIEYMRILKRKQLLLQGGVMYLSTQFLLLGSSLLYSDSQNIQKLIYWVILHSDLC